MDRNTLRKTLRSSAPVIAPSMLKCDFGHLADEVAALAGATLLHWDVMDGHFVPNLSYGAMVAASVTAPAEQRHSGKCFSESHLMMSDPERYLDEYLEWNDSIVIHIEAVPEPESMLKRIADSETLAGLAINPATPVDTVRPYLELCDEVLVMSVEPGFGGQSFMPDVLPKVEQLRSWLDDEQLISIDGGIGESTIARASAAGCDLFVAGSAIFDRDDYQTAMTELTELARNSRSIA